jgi:hypothetical protein
MTPTSYVSLLSGEAVDPFDPERMSFTELPGGSVLVHLGLTEREEAEATRMAAEDGYDSMEDWLDALFRAGIQDVLAEDGIESEQNAKEAQQGP